MTLRIVTPPAAEPVTAAEVKTSGRHTGTGLDTRIDSLIIAARRVAENLTGRALITQTWEQVIDAFPANEIRLGLMPVQSISSVSYYDTDGNLQVVDSADYTLDADTMPGWVLPAYGSSWPATKDIAQAVIIRFVAGYGASGSDVPAEIKEWIIAQVVAAIENPAALMAGNAQPLQFLDSLLDAYRVRLFA